MLYSFHELQRTLLRPLAETATATATWLQRQDLLPARLASANLALLHRIIKPYGKPAFALENLTAHGRPVAITEEVVLATPFCRLLRFVRTADHAETAAALAAAPRVLVCAPLSGHHPTLVRDTVATLLQDHDVYITDWTDAREVPVEHGVFHLDDYVALIQLFLRTLGPASLHVVSVCQPTVPVLAAVALMAAGGEPTPRSLTLMGGPLDARKSPTVVNKFATDHSIGWFESNMIHRVPGNHAGRGRAVYPGFLQLTAFVMMNPARHADSYQAYWFDQLRGESGAPAVRAHEKFYDEYNAVLDMDAAYYLDTVRVVFQEFALARGTWDVHGQRVDPAAITATALFTIEGSHDDISGLGQTEAAHAMCPNVPASMRRHLVAEGCGHYGLFSGSKWREHIYPELRQFIAAQQSDGGAV